MFWVNTCEAQLSQCKAMGKMYWTLNALQEKGLEEFLEQDTDKMSNKEYNIFIEIKERINNIRALVASALEDIRDSFQHLIYNYLLCSMSYDKRKEFLALHPNIESFLEEFGMEGVRPKNEELPINSIRAVMAFATQILAHKATDLTEDWEEPFYKRMTDVINEDNKISIAEYGKKNEAILMGIKK